MLSVHPSRRHLLKGPDRVTVRAGRRDHRVHRYLRQHLYPRAGASRARCDSRTRRSIEDSGLPDAVDSSAREVPVEELPAETLRFLMASRFCEVDLLSPDRRGTVRRRAAGMGAGQGDLRLGAHEGDLQLSARPADADGARRLHRAHRRLPGLPAPGHHVLPLPEHPRALCDRLPGRHRRRRRARRRWISAPGSRSTWRTAGGRSTRATTSRASAGC